MEQPKNMKRKEREDKTRATSAPRWTPQHLPQEMGELGPPAYLTGHLFETPERLAIIKQVAAMPEFVEQGLLVHEYEPIEDGRIRFGITPGDHKGNFLGPFWGQVDILEAELRGTTTAHE